MSLRRFPVRRYPRRTALVVFLLTVAVGACRDLLVEPASLAPTRLTLAVSPDPALAPEGSAERMAIDSAWVQLRRESAVLFDTSLAINPGRGDTTLRLEVDPERLGTGPAMLLLELRADGAAVLRGATPVSFAEGHRVTAVITASAVVHSVRVTPAADSVVAGQSRNLVAALFDAEGSPVTGRPVLWSASDTTVLRVSATGTVTGVRAGSARVTAESEGRTGSAEIRVLAPVAAVALSPDSVVVATGAGQPVDATLRDAAGNVLTGRPVAWTSSDTTVAIVSATGDVRGVRAGRTTITATSEGQHASVPVRVRFGAGSYRVVELPTLPGSNIHWNEINNNADLVGDATAVGDSIARPLILRGGTIVELGNSGRRATAYGLNDAGHVVGYENDPGGYLRPFLWRDGTLVLLPTFSASGFNGAYAINRNGEIAGELYNGTQERAVIWRDGTPMDLGVRGWALDISDSGIAAVTDYLPGNPYVLRAVRWRAGTAEALPGLGGTYDYPFSVNESGDIVGVSRTAAGVDRPALWRGSRVIDLGAEGDTRASAEDINDAGQVVGWVRRVVGTATATIGFLWHDGERYDLSTLVEGTDWVITQASSINDRGDILARGCRGTTCGSVLLRPVTPGIAAPTASPSPYRESATVRAGSVTPAPRRDPASLRRLR